MRHFVPEQSRSCVQLESHREEAVAVVRINCDGELSYTEGAKFTPKMVTQETIQQFKRDPRVFRC